MRWRERELKEGKEGSQRRRQAIGANLSIAGRAFQGWEAMESLAGLVSSPGNLKKSKNIRNLLKAWWCKEARGGGITAVKCFDNICNRLYLVQNLSI